MNMCVCVCERERERERESLKCATFSGFPLQSNCLLLHLKSSQ